MHPHILELKGCILFLCIYILSCIYRGTKTILLSHNDSINMTPRFTIIANKIPTHFDWSIQYFHTKSRAIAKWTYAYFSIGEILFQRLIPFFAFDNRRFLILLHFISIFFIFYAFLFYATKSPENKLSSLITLSQVHAFQSFDISFQDGLGKTCEAES